MLQTLRIEFEKKEQEKEMNEIKNAKDESEFSKKIIQIQKKIKSKFKEYSKSENTKEKSIFKIETNKDAHTIKDKKRLFVKILLNTSKNIDNVNKSFLLFEGNRASKSIEISIKIFPKQAYSKDEDIVEIRIDTFLEENKIEKYINDAFNAFMEAIHESIKD